MAIEDGAEAGAGEQPEPSRRGRESRREWRAHQTPAVLAQALKERVYATFTGLAIVLVLRAHAPTPQDATYSLFIGVLGITVAGFAAEVIAHLAAHASFPDREEIGRMLRIAGGALASVGVPVVLLLCSWPGWISVETALAASTWVYLATLGLIAWAAVRRTALSWGQRLLALAALVLLGGIVIALQLLAHS
ncbi:hypothetical protein [Agromyces neolithicus]|uniref:Yip1 domain-containing protein n=1 Tax=Agromyces neolithicus TaxID=269420 RepID=A0ABN2M4B4_9MICO